MRSVGSGPKQLPKKMRKLIAVLVTAALIVTCLAPGFAFGEGVQEPSNALDRFMGETLDDSFSPAEAEENGPREKGLLGADDFEKVLDLCRAAEDVTWYKLVEAAPNISVRLQDVRSNGLYGKAWIRFIAEGLSSGILVLPFDSAGRAIDPTASPNATIQFGEHYVLTDGEDVRLITTVDGSGTWNMYRNQVYQYLAEEEVGIPSDLLGIVTWKDVLLTYPTKVRGTGYAVFDGTGQRILSPDPVPVAVGQHVAIATGTTAAKGLAIGTVVAAPPVDMPAAGTTWSDIQAQTPGLKVDLEPLGTLVWHEDQQQYVVRNVTWMEYFLAQYVGGGCPIPFSKDGTLIPISQWNQRLIERGDHILGTGRSGSPYLVEFTDPRSGVSGNYKGYHASFGFPTLSMSHRTRCTMIDSGIGLVLTGSSIKTAKTGTTVGDIKNLFNYPSGSGSELLTADRQVKQDDLQVCTGDILLLASMGGTVQEVTLVVAGDVLGTGVMTVAQLVRTAKALTGDPLKGAYFLAGDLSDTGKIDITDLVSEAEILHI